MIKKLFRFLICRIVVFTMCFAVACSNNEAHKTSPERGQPISRDEIRISVKADEKIGNLNPELFSSFVEHLGRQVYGGIYNPEHSSADAEGFRTDIIDLVKGLNINYVRYPGGNFVSGYNWKDGIGNDRQPKIDITASQLDPNTMGVDEFMKWAEKVGVEVIMAVNLGNGTPESAAELVEYCNCTDGYWAERRKENGHAEPYNIKYWCLGNEMDGDWQIGHCNAYEYSDRANAAALLMKEKDPSIKLIYCGSCSMASSTFLSWDRTVLSKCIDNIDYLSIHSYFSYDRTNENLNAFLNSYRLLDGFIEKIDEVITNAKTQNGENKQIKISLDEWNVWYSDEGSDYSQGTNVIGPKRCENIYTAMDATVVATLMSSILNHCDSVGIACMAQLVNVIAPIMADPNGNAICQTTYYPFKLINENVSGSMYKCDVKVTDMNAGKFGEVPSGCACFSYDEKTKEGTMLVCNLANRERRLIYDVKDFGDLTPYEFIGMEGDVRVMNTFGNPNSAVPITNKLSSDKSIVMKPYSWNLVKFRTA